MTLTSGFVGGFINIAKPVASGEFSAAIQVFGGVTSNFDAQLGVSRTDIMGEFDAQVCVVIAAEQVIPTAQILTPTDANSSGLPPFNLSFTGTGTASGEKTIVEHTWFFHDTLQTTVSGGTSTDHIFTNSGSHLVTLRVMDSDGFYGFDSKRILLHSGVILDLPLLTTSGIPQSGNVPLTVDFISSASGVIGTTILGFGWSFGHTRFSRRQDQNDIVYQVPGKYIPVCTVADSRGVLVSDQVEIGANN
jgi:hypothetical protein